MKKKPVDDDYEAPELTKEMLKGAKFDNGMLPRGSKVVHVETKGGVVYSKSVRGGARPGAGRKPSAHVSMRINIRPETRKRIEALAKKQGMTMSAVVDGMFAK